MRSAFPEGMPAVDTAGEEDELGRARQVADAVLYEGYVLFPYRASATKNRFRWQWGVVVPGEQGALGQAEPSSAVCEVLVRDGGAASHDGGGVPGIEVTARFLRLRHRQMVDANGCEVERLDVGGEPIPTWDEGLEQEVAASPVALHPTTTDGQDQPAARVFDLPGERQVERHPGIGAAVRTTEHLRGELRIDRRLLDDEVIKLTVTVANTTGWAERRAPRDIVLRHSLIGVHVMLRATGGAEIASAIDPPGWAAPWEEERASRGLYPVLAGGPIQPDDGTDPRAGTLALALPIILADFPEVAPESTGQSFDATEVDELLALCVQGLSDAERAEARATDARAAELIDRTTALPAAVMDRLHGAVRSRATSSGNTAGAAADAAEVKRTLENVELSPEPEVHITPETAAALGVGEVALERLRLGQVEIEVGSRVRLRPRRRADAQDLFLDGRVGHVERIVTTDDGEAYVAVTVEDDPAAELHRWYGRYHYFSCDEIEPIAAASKEGAPQRSF